tara:strand:- start:227 stop:460 length:234 start_codon:yes stop_codon:yes gene_type:complete
MLINTSFYIISPSVGQEKKLNFWGIDSVDAVHAQTLDGTLEGDSDEGRVIAMSHSGKFIATGGTGGVLRLWSYESST